MTKSEWSPITTLPKDGSVVDIYYAGPLADASDHKGSFVFGPVYWHDGIKHGTGYSGLKTLVARQGVTIFGAVAWRHCDSVGAL